MSKDILGSLVRVLVTVPEDRLGLMQDFANKLAGPDGDTWFRQGKSFFRKEPCWTNDQVVQVAEPEPIPSILELEPAKRWCEQDGVIYFTLPATKGVTGPQWIKHLEKKGFRLSDRAKSMLRSEDFKPTTGVVRKIAVLKGMLFEDDNRTTKDIRAEGDKRKLKHGKAPEMNAEIACQIREMFTDKELEEMGLWWIVVMHDPIVSDGSPNLFNALRDDDGRWLNAYCDNPDGGFNRERGFAFVVSQVQN
jgi:hypothetical protein